jgi:predicted transcriptional regulator
MPVAARKRPAPVPDAELAVLKVLWEEETATIREIVDRLYPGGGTSEYGTVQKLLERLQQRGHVARNREGRVHRFSALATRENLIRQSLQEAAEKLCEGSLTPLLTQLVEAEGLSARDIQALRELVERLAGEKR